MKGCAKMGCIKCGRETVSEQVFCPECSAEMEKYPVRPGTVVQLPNRKNITSTKRHTKKRSTPLEEQVKTLTKRCRTLTILLIVAVLVAIALAIPAAEHLTEGHFKIGQNYTTVTHEEN